MQIEKNSDKMHKKAGGGKGRSERKRISKKPVSIVPDLCL